MERHSKVGNSAASNHKTRQKMAKARPRPTPRQNQASKVIRKMHGTSNRARTRMGKDRRKVKLLNVRKIHRVAAAINRRKRVPMRNQASDGRMAIKRLRTPSSCKPWESWLRLLASVPRTLRAI